MKLDYIVISDFIDKQDEGHRYRKGDAFPREGKAVSDERMEFLLSIPFIKLVEPKEPEDPYKDKELPELKALLDEKGIEYAKNASREKAIELLENTTLEE